MGLCIFQTTQHNLHNICKMFQNAIPKNPKRSLLSLQHTSRSLRHPSRLELAACSNQDLQHGSSNSSSSPLEGGGDHRGGVGVIGGRDSPWDERVGFEAPVSGGSTPLLLPHTHSAQVKGEAPAYCLSLCRRPSGHGMYSYACSGSGSGANGVCTVGCRA